MTEMWTRPMAEVQQFAANEYVAACGQTVDGKYLFECNAGDRKHTYSVYDSDHKRWIASNVWGSGAQFSGYHPCKETHKADSMRDFVNGYMDDQSTRVVETIPVIIWTDGGRNVHCTTNLDREHWTVERS